MMAIRQLGDFDDVKAQSSVLQSLADASPKRYFSPTSTSFRPLLTQLFEDLQIEVTQFQTPHSVLLYT